MKRILLIFLTALMAVACSKKIEVKGKIANGSPLERIEIIEGSGVATLPLINIGLNAKGEFSGSFDAPRDGMYVLTYGGKMAMIYLKKGQTLNISGQGATFPQEFTVTGDAKPNNDFIKDAQKSFDTYAQKINVVDLIAKNESQFLTGFNKIQTDLMKVLDDAAKKYNADAAAVSYKKDETNARLLSLLDAYEQNHGQTVGTPYKISKKFEEVRSGIMKDNDRMVKEVPAYRDYLLNNLNADFQKFAQSQKPDANTLISDMFAKFLATKKDLSQTAKDYLFAYVIAQTDINYNNVKKYGAISKLIDTNVSDSGIKSNLKKLQTVLMGFQPGTVPELALVKKEGGGTQLSTLKGRPTMVMFYSSWDPNIAVAVTPVLKEVADFYKSKMDFAYVNLDDSKEQFIKTSDAMMKNFPGKNYWVEGGINAEAAKNFGIYGFKTPSFILLDKDGKIYSRPYFNLGDPQLVTDLNSLTGLKAPEVQQPMPQMMPQNMAPAPGRE